MQTRWLKMVSSDSPFSSTTRSPVPKFSNSFTTRIFSDVAGDITIVVDGESFLLHKFPLVSRSGKIRKMVADAKDSNNSKLELLNLPGGPPAFELAMKFCYGMNFEITTVNRIEDEDYEDCGYESEGLGSPGHGSLLKVGRLIDSYLAEIAPDPYLSLQKFIAMIEILPDYSRVIDDGLYRAIDIYIYEGSSDAN
ncbi:hypothetical protein EZV62_015323 [Acer yangbiense]|uniref:BTB domain-containing protein n=1 Tax=Acer yangbiense TaxID=1000413 RepID=A0A5C7HKS6_9ROSI|nr:hypothetical protein EZV62_015323 [Acer yangbiense]